MAGFIEYNGSFTKEEEFVLKLEISILYFVHNGRNAWNNTWAQRYYPDSFHTTLDEAKKQCEFKRNNGTVFYIIETPTLIIESSENIKYYITQINISEPLSNYSAEAVISKKDYKGVLEKDSQDNYFKRGVLLRSLISSFDTYSRFWKNTESTEKVITLVGLKENQSKNQYFIGKKLTSYKSKSFGTNYYLDWSTHTIQRKADSLINLLNQFKANTKKIKKPKPKAHILVLSK